MKNTSVAAGCAVLFCLILANPLPQARAEDEASPEHGKINAADASPVDPGHYEVEASYAFGFSDKAWSGGGNDVSRGFSSDRALGLSGTAGISDNFDISAAIGYSWLKDKDNDFDDDGTPGPSSGKGFGDIEVGGRYRFYQNEKLHVEAAYIGGVTLPTGRDSDSNDIGASQEYWSIDQTLVASKDWGKWTANADIGYALPFGDDRHAARGTLNADVAGGYQVLPWLQPELEINYARDFIADAGDAETIALTAGLVMPIAEALRVNIGVQQSVWGQNADKATTVSVALKTAF